MKAHHIVTATLFYLSTYCLAVGIDILDKFNYEEQIAYGLIGLFALIFVGLILAPKDAF